jgi:protein-tyrosine phosphatase
MIEVADPYNKGLSSGGGLAMDHDRVLAAKELFNLRDLGGYPAAEGRRVCWGLVYRAGELSSSAEEDRVLLEERHIAAIVDFRSAGEAFRNPDISIATARFAIGIPIDAGNLLVLSRQDGSGDGEKVMEEMYRRLVEEALPQYRRFFAVLSDRAKVPVLFHCSAGKDRTGLAAALFLSALGTDRECVYDDYLLSASYLPPGCRLLMESEPAFGPMMTVRRSYLEAAFARIDERFGGMGPYLERELNADTALLREIYTV